MQPLLAGGRSRVQQDHVGQQLPPGAVGGGTARPARPPSPRGRAAERWSGRGGGPRRGGAGGGGERGVVGHGVGIPAARPALNRCYTPVEKCGQDGTQRSGVRMPIRRGKPLVRSGADQGLRLRLPGFGNGHRPGKLRPKLSGRWPSRRTPARAAPAPGRPAPPAPAGAAPAPPPRCSASHASVASSVSARSWYAGNRPRTTSMPIWIDRSRHTRSIAAKYSGAYGAVSSRCDGCAKPAIVASTSAFDSASDSHHLRPRLRLHRRRRPRRQTAHLVPLARRRVVPGQLRRQHRLVRHPVRGQRLQERPAQLLVHLQPVDLDRAVQQVLQQRQAPLGGGHGREEPRPRQLVLTARFGLPQLLHRAPWPAAPRRPPASPAPRSAPAPSSPRRAASGAPRCPTRGPRTAARDR